MLPDAHLAAITAIGGLLLVGVALRLLRIREIPVADLLPALLVAPLLVGRGRRPALSRDGSMDASGDAEVGLADARVVEQVAARCRT